MTCVKFSELTQLLASNFWAGDLDPEALRVRPRPQKVGFLQNISPPGLWGKVDHVISFQKWEDKAKKILGTEF